MGDVGFTSNQFAYRTWGTAIYIEAVFCNPTSQAYKYIDYRVDAINASGGVIESITRSDSRVIWPGEFLCTEDYLSIKPPGVVGYRYTITAKTPYTDARRAVAVLGPSFNRSTMTVAGQLRNDDPTASVYSRVTVGLYDSQSRIVLCDTYATQNAYSLAPGQITSFNADFWAPSPDAQSIYDRVYTYRINISQ